MTTWLGSPPNWKGGSEAVSRPDLCKQLFVRGGNCRQWIPEETANRLFTNLGDVLLHPAKKLALI
jgi:hypothetical protein